MEDCAFLVVVNEMMFMCVCVMKQCDILKVKNTLVKSVVYCVMMHRYNLVITLVGEN